MPQYFTIEPNYEYDKMRLMSMVALGDREYMGFPFHEHLKDISQTLIEYGYYDLTIHSALWLSFQKCGLKYRLNNYGKIPTMISVVFKKILDHSKPDLSAIKNKEVRRAAIVLYMAKKVTDLTYAINNDDETYYKVCVSNFKKLEKLYKDNEELTKYGDASLYYFIETCAMCENLNSYYEYYTPFS